MNPIGPQGNRPSELQPPVQQGQRRVSAAVARIEGAAVAGNTNQESAGQPSANRGTTISGIFSSAISVQTEGQKRGNEWGRANTETVFSGLDRRTILDTIQAGKKVFVAGFSSNGSGHTGRMFTPLGKALEQGDTVVLALPPHWEDDTGREARTLDKFKEDYQKNGAQVVTVQSDKTVLGFLKKDGPADNFAALQEFANKPKRDNSQTSLYGSEEKGLGFKHKDIVRNLVDIVGEDSMAQIRVFEDMDPYLEKAAASAGIPGDQIVGQGNHMLMLDATEYLGAKKDAFLVKANGNGHNGRVATIGLSKDINTTRALGATLSTLKIKADNRAVDVRKDMIGKLLEHGKRHDLSSDEKVSMKGTMLVSPQASVESVDRGVYLYVNAYTDPLGQHIRERLNGAGDTTADQKEAYEKTMFVVCGGATLPKGTPGSDNAMHVAQAANFDGVTNAGFGTSSEMHYLLENDAYQGNFLLMPLEQHHEQETNAFSLLPMALSPENQGRVAAAENIEQLKDKLDDMVLNKAVTNDRLGQTTMAPLLEATLKEGEDFADNAANLLRGAEMSDTDARLLAENNQRAADPSRKEVRHLNKVMIPVLEALSNGTTEATIRLSTEEDARTVNIKDLVDGLDNPAILRSLTGVNISSEVGRNLSEKFAEDLRALLDVPAGTIRQQMTDAYSKDEYANRTFTLGF